MSTRFLPQWIDDFCERNSSLYERAGRLYDSWRNYCRGLGGGPGSIGEFGRAMDARGFVSDRIPPIERGCIRWGCGCDDAGGITIVDPSDLERRWKGQRKPETAVFQAIGRVGKT